MDDVTYYPWGDVESMRYEHDGTYYEDVTFTRGKWFQLKNIDVEDNSQNLLIHSKYTYDLGGNIATTSVDMDTATSDSYTESFTYNSLSMLTQAAGPYGSSGANKTYSYTYEYYPNFPCHKR